MLNFDDHKRVLRCSVRDLVDGDTEDIGFAGGGRGLRARAGMQVHAAVRAAVADNAATQAEVTLHWGFKRADGWWVEIEGRVDLLISSAQGYEVVEIKSTFLGGADLVAMLPVRSHREQCALYCLMLVRSGRPVRCGRLRYRSLADDSQRDIDIDFAADAAEDCLQARLDALFREHGQALDRARRRRALAETLVFPFPTRRDGQSQMIDRIDAVAQRGGVLFCSAPTGIGKTAAALFPMARAALANDMRLFFVTAKISQQELAVDTLRRLIPPDHGGCAMQLTAKERSCPALEMRCDPRDCPYLADFSLRLERSGLLDRLEAAGVAAGAMITAASTAEQLCPFEVSLALTQRASIMVSDYNYVFDPRLALKRFFDAPSASPLLLVADEAHNLPARVRGYYSPELDGAELGRVAALCAAQKPAVYADLARLFTEVSDAVAGRINELHQMYGEQPVWIGAPDRRFFIEASECAEIRVQEYLFFRHQLRDRRPPAGLEPEPRGGGRRFRDPILSACFAIRDYGECCRHDPDRFEGLWFADGPARLWCLDPAPFLRERLDGFHGAVLMSATLSPFDFFLRMTGLAERTVDMLDLPSPFPPSRRLIAAVPAVDTRYRQRDRSVPVIADILQRTIRLRQGNYLAFFPSFAYRDQVMAAVPPGPYRLVLQQPAMETTAVLDDLENNLVETILLCAVQGGVFAEGVDYPGHLAVGAFIIGPGLPKVAPEQELIRAYHDRHDGNGFRYAYVSPGLNRVVQAGGRIIRRDSDCGFILLMDRRLASAGYREKMPGYWRDELQIVADPVAAVQDFWQRCDADTTRTCATVNPAHPEHA